MLAYGIGFFLSGVVALFISLVQWLKMLYFRNDVATCTATVTQVRSRKVGSSGSRRSGGARVYQLQVVYVVNGVDYTSWLDAQASQVKDAVGRQVDILYKIYNPKRIASADPEEHRSKVMFFLYAGLALLALGTVLLLLSRVFR